MSEPIVSSPEILPSPPGQTAPLRQTFEEKLLSIMQEKNLTAPEVYKRANVDKTLFSKILSDRFYSPSRDTAIAIAFGLSLSLEEANDLIERAGFTLSGSIKRDAVLENCFRAGMSDVTEVNLLLHSLAMKPLGRST